MKLRGYRITKARLADDAFSGEGARVYGGRWNHPGTAIVYVASSRSLAMLEMLVHMESHHLLLSYVVFPIEFDNSLVTDVDFASLPRDWRASPAAPEVRAIGDHWAHSGRSAILRVPSAVVEDEDNYLINPAHQDFKKIRIGKRKPIEFDSRFK